MGYLPALDCGVVSRGPLGSHALSLQLMRALCCTASLLTGMQEDSLVPQGGKLDRQSSACQIRGLTVRVILRMVTGRASSPARLVWKEEISCRKEPSWASTTGNLAPTILLPLKSFCTCAPGALLPLVLPAHCLLLHAMNA